MGRIRSVHPGLFTDEDFVQLSDAAQVFFIGLWTEADDFGAFEWKPTTLKMKLRPASTTPIEPLLEELLACERVLKYEYEGRHYGLIRNFRAYQRPKFPKSRYFIPTDYRKFTSSSDTITEIAVDDEGQFPRKAEMASQREEVIGGGNRRGRGNKTPIPPGFSISERVKDWATKHGFDRLDAHLDAFQRKCLAKGYTYIDWDSAFMEAVREDWAKLRGGKPGQAPPPTSDGRKLASGDRW